MCNCIAEYSLRIGRFRFADRWVQDNKCVLVKDIHAMLIARAMVEEILKMLSGVSRPEFRRSRQVQA